MQDHAAPLTHDWIWRAIDTLAASRRLSASGLARLAGLDPTAFNPSKRFTPEGRPRWPSTESIAKVLAATGMSLDAFADIELSPVGRHDVPRADGDRREVPVVGEVRGAVVFEMSRCGGSRTTARPHKPATPPRRFALEVADGSLEPAYSRGHRLIAAVGDAAKPGDRVIVKPAGRNPMPRVVVSSTAHRLRLATIQASDSELELPRRRIDWIARIVAPRR